MCCKRNVYRELCGLDWTHEPPGIVLQLEILEILWLFTEVQNFDKPRSLNLPNSMRQADLPKLDHDPRTLLARQGSYMLRSAPWHSMTRAFGDGNLQQVETQLWASNP